MAKIKTEEKELREAMNEIVTGTRVFKTGKYGLVQVRFPTTEEQRLADFEYSLTMTKALRSGLMTNNEIEKMLKAREIWGEKEEEKAKEIDEKINAEVMYLSKLKTAEKQKPVQNRINTLKQERLDLLSEKQKFFNISAETKADEARISYLTYCCTENAKTQDPLWKNYDEFKNEHNGEDLSQIIIQFLTFINGISPNLLELSQEEEEPQEESGEQSGE